MISNAKKAVIHIARQQTGMTEEEYRDLLSSVGAASSKDLTDVTFEVVMGRFEAIGYRPAKKRPRKIKSFPVSKVRLMKKLEAILLDMGLQWGYVESIAKSRFKVEKVEWLDPDQLYKVVQMMAVHQKRKATKESANG